MRNITLSADEDSIERARERARRENRSLNDVFRDWLEVYSGKQKSYSLGYFQEKWKHVKTGGPYSREEMNERR